MVCFSFLLHLFPQSVFYFLGIEVGTLGISLARQALYRWSHASSPFCSGHFGARILLFAQADLDHILLF
jgi:hypothetical protein